MNSEDYGSYQRRGRLILTIAAPSLPPLQKPSVTHGTPAARTILPDKESRCSYTPFRKIDFGDGTLGLPHVDIVQACIQFPDHRLPNNTLRETRREFAQIPLGHSEKPYREHKRICECCPMPTIRTTNTRQNEEWGPYLHWREHRLLTVQDARRARLWPDDEPIVGTSSQQYAIVGNGVDRSVSYPLGQSLLQSIREGRSTNQKNVNVQVAIQHTFCRIGAQPEKHQITAADSAVLDNTRNLLPTPALTPDRESSSEPEDNPETSATLDLPLRACMVKTTRILSLNLSSI